MLFILYINIYIYIYIYIPFYIPYKIFKKNVGTGGCKTLSAFFFVWPFESCKFHYLSEMATHALGHMIYGLQIAGTNEYMNIYIFIEE